jgi:hypothetical protein
MNVERRSIVKDTVRGKESTIEKEMTAVIEMTRRSHKDRDDGDDKKR